tara:strand:- start:1200 stop:1727 length:528 start_codon:yes stop_codon:yes gene_type:complete
MRKTKLIPALLLLFLCFTKEHLIAQTDESFFTIYLIRHSEKDTLYENQLDPPLTTCGIERSKYLGSFFEDINIKNVYSTNYLRTIKTAMPTALSKKVGIQYYDSNNLRLFSEQLLNLKQNSLVVGHSNTTPILAGLLTGKDMNPFDENIYNRIYKVIVSQNKKKLFVLETSFVCN